MSIGVIAKLSIKEGCNQAFEEKFAELAASVRANEPGNNFYSLHKSRTDNLSYVVLEEYVDEAALAAHGKSDYFKTLGAELGPNMAGAPEVEYFDGI
ncbi:MAG: putative quinol monooxygenase [Pseudomonadales bacterium]|nr:putative quinol monooxygenase [Pseudomonadales bacterium]